MAGHPGGRGKLSAPPRPIGFGGSHNHGRDLDDPVYPTKHVPAALLPSFPQDWRSAGRALLVMGMSALEGSRLRSKGKVLKWQAQGLCSSLCGVQCAKSPNRIFCAWRVGDTVHEHHNRMDGFLMSFKGVVHHEDIKKPIYRVRRQVAAMNRFKSERMTWASDAARYIYSDREDIHPAFNIRQDRDESHYPDGEAGYDSGSDAEASSADEDSDGDGCA